MKNEELRMKNEELRMKIEELRMKIEELGSYSHRERNWELRIYVSIKQINA